MNLLDFMTESPILTFILVVVIFATLENIVTRVSQVLISKNCKCNEKEIEEEDC